MSQPVELVLTRTFNAPRELVFRVCTEAEHLANWWGPKGGAMNVAKLELTPGGMFLYSQNAGGHTLWGKFVYREIVAPEKLVFINSFSDEEGNTIRAPFSATWPLEIFNTWLLEEQDGQTVVTMRGTPVSPTDEELQTFAGAKDMLQQGFSGTFSQLDEYLATLAPQAG